MFNKLNPNSLTIDEFTTVDPITILPDCLATTAKKAMMDRGFRHLPVTDGEAILGVLSERDVHALDENSSDQTKVSELMTKNPYMVKSDDLLRTVVMEMASRKIGSALVMTQNNELYGIFTSIDALHSIVELIHKLSLANNSIAAG